ncbi:hypothetical protein [Parasphingorhabdus sp.]|uniref:hypothetical protein n=1 Tax=Parasphingorhabdus sp. TaxID=2709688 RepID=UPI002F94470A
MNWKRNIQVLDLEPSDRLELLCRKCGKLRWLTGEELLSRPDAKYLWLEDVERRARCRQRGCGGTMRMAMPGEGETSGFVGGIA